MRSWVSSLVLLVGCGHATGTPSPVDDAPDVAYRGGDASMSRAADAQLIAIPGGRYVTGSTPEEREQAYLDYSAAAGHDDARDAKWFDLEEDRHSTELGAFRVDLLPVTNAQYGELVADGGAPAPTMDEAKWAAQGFQQPWPDEVERFVWHDGRPPPNREDHPVVLVTHDEAARYCAWRGAVVGERRRLPTAAEYERASRGVEAQAYPWGSTWDATRLNSFVGGPNDTVPVGEHPDAASPDGVLDLAGNVFHWTSTPWPPGAGRDAPKRTVRGSSWEDWPGLGRGAAWHGRARTIRHVIVGFRCAADAR